MKHLDTTPRERRLVLVHAWLILLTTTFVVGLAALVLVMLPHQHVAEAEVEVLDQPTRAAPLPPTMGTERRIALSGSVAAEAAARMGTGVDAARQGLDVSVVTDSEVLVVRYAAASAPRALQGARAFTRSYVAHRNARYETRTAEVITPATLLPPSGGGPSPWLLMPAALLLGLGLGTLLAFLWDRVSDRVRSSGELVRTGVPVLVDRLVVDGDDRWDRSMLGTGESGYLASRLTALVGGERTGVRILVTSPRGTPTVARAAALTAVALAAAGRPAVLVDPDGAGRRGSAAPGPGRGEGSSAAELGLSDVVSGRCSPEAAMRPTPVEGLRFVGPGTVTQDLALADVDSVTTVLSEMATHASVVLTGPPLLTSGQGWLFADHADVVLLVAQPPRLRRRDASRVGEMMTAAGRRTAGWVVVRARRPRITRPHATRPDHRPPSPQPAARRTLGTGGPRAS